MSIFMECDEAANQVSMVDPDAGKLTYEYAAEGDKVFDASYDAWGNQTVAKNDIGFHRGYTGREHLDEFGLINMNGRALSPSGESNGRLYDPPPLVRRLHAGARQLAEPRPQLPGQSAGIVSQSGDGENPSRFFFFEVWIFYCTLTSLNTRCAPKSARLEVGAPVRARAAEAGEHHAAV